LFCVENGERNQTERRKGGKIGKRKSSKPWIHTLTNFTVVKRGREGRNRH